MVVTYYRSGNNEKININFEDIYVSQIDYLKLGSVAHMLNKTKAHICS